MNAGIEQRDDGDVGGHDGGEVVVAVDGSEPSRAALVWAVREAAGTGRRVRAVRVFDPAFLYSPQAPVIEAIPMVRAAEREALRESVEQTVGAPAGVRLEQELLEGEPATELARRADGAAMLVMGSHGRGRIGSSLLGSVSAACVHRAHCPVLIIPAKAAVSLLAAPACVTDAKGRQPLPAASRADRPTG